MTNEEILKKAIGKAIKGGYSHAYYLQGSEDELYRDSDLWWGIIFSHKFAKAFFKLSEEELNHHKKRLDEYWEGFKPKFIGDTPNKVCPVQPEMWQHHLQQMVLEEDPIKYLEEFIK